MIEVSIWAKTKLVQRRLPWRPYRPPVRFEDIDGYGLVTYRCGDVEIEGRFVLADADGIVEVDQPDVVARFIVNLYAFPAFVPAVLVDRIVLTEVANQRRIPFHNFTNGIGFRTPDEAVLVKMTMPQL